ncbi:unnamed protein product, partial [Rotaria magnacalcarata]
MAKRNDFQICQKYLDNHINTIKKEIDTCDIQLNNQNQSYPVTTLSLDQHDHYLKAFVDCQRKYLSMRNNKQLQKFIDDFHEKQLFETISTYHLTIVDQVCLSDFLIESIIFFLLKISFLESIYHRLMSIREKQATIYEELLMLEMRVLCKFLSKNFDQLEEFIAPMIYSPLNNDQKMIEVRNKRYKTIQEAKRIWLNVFLKSYEVQLQEYDQQYKNESLQLESHLLNNILSVFGLNHILIYLPMYSINTNGIIFHLVNFIFLIITCPSCIRINQSAIRPRHQQEIAIQKDHKSIYDKVRSHLNEHYFVPMTATILKQYSNQLLHDLNLSYFSPLSYSDQTLALKQAKNVVSIQRKIKKYHLILRVTDKGYNFYIGTEKEFDKKAQNFFS